MTLTQRRQRIHELISSRPVHSQQELADLLAADGIGVTQATLSRDLRQLGVVKGSEGYLPPGGPHAPHDNGQALQRTLKRELLAVDCGGTLVILHTRPGHANALAVELDRVRPEEVMGTVAGDDTIFVAVRTAKQARAMARRYRSLAGHE